MTEFISRPFADRSDEFVGVLLRANTHDFKVIFDCVVANSMEQVSFAKPGSAMNVERIEIFTGMFGDFHGSCIGKIVRITYHEIIECVTWIKKRELALFGNGLSVIINDLELKIYICVNNSCIDSFN